MDFIRIIVYLCLSTVLLAARVNRSDTKEPVCYSRYDYEIKMLREMASLEETEAHLTEKTVGLQNEVDGIKTEMKAVPPTIAFMAQLSSNVEVPATGKTHHTIVFDDVITNEGLAYNKYTGAFTAPMDATYHFNLELSIPNGNTGQVLRVTLQKNGERAGYIFFEVDDHLWLRRTTSVTHHLARGDTIQVIVQLSQGSKPNVIAGYNFHSHFSGFLIGR